MLQDFGDTAFDMSNVVIRGYTSGVYPVGGVSRNDLRKILYGGQWRQNGVNIAENFNRLSRVHKRYRQTDRQTDDTENYDGKYLNVT